MAAPQTPPQQPWLCSSHSAGSCPSRSCHPQHDNRPKHPRIVHLEHNVSSVHSTSRYHDLHSAPSAFACSSTNGSFHDRSPSMTPISSSACVVNPVIFLSWIMGLPVAGSRRPANIAGPWQLILPSDTLNMLPEDLELTQQIRRHHCSIPWPRSS